MIVWYKSAGSEGRVDNGCRKRSGIILGSSLIDRQNQPTVMAEDVPGYQGGNAVFDTRAVASLLSAALHPWLTATPLKAI